MSNYRQIKTTSHHTLSICYVSSYRITPQSHLEKGENKAAREESVLSVTYALSILNKKHLHLLKPLAPILCDRDAVKNSSVADAGICERKR